MKNKFAKIVVMADITSIATGFIAVTLGTMSVIALQSFWSPMKENRDFASFVFTALTLIFDSISTLSAFLAFVAGGKLMSEEGPTNPKHIRYEHLSLKFDICSFSVGAFGLIFGAISLVTLFKPIEQDLLSEIITIISIFLDTASSVLVIIALTYFMKSLEKIAPSIVEIEKNAD